MKTYPSILRSTGQNFQEFKAHVWDKLDGQNVRGEFSRKRGWYKFGSRTQRIDSDSVDFSPVIPLFIVPSRGNPGL